MIPLAVYHYDSIIKNTFSQICSTYEFERSSDTIQRRNEEFQPKIK